MTSDEVPVVLLTVDSIRFDRFGPSHLPQSFPIIADDFAVFNRCLSHGVATPFAFPAIIGGDLCRGDGTLLDTPTIAEFLGSRRCSAFTNNGHLSERKGYARGFNRFGMLKPPTGRHPVHRLKQIDLFRRMPILPQLYRFVIDRYRDSSRYTGDSEFPIPYEPAMSVTSFLRSNLNSDPPPGMVWGHYMDPHTPFHPDTAVDLSRSFEDRSKLRELMDRFTTGSADAVSPAEMDELRALYDANVRYLDQHLARLLRWLRERTWYDDALVIVVGDHGELFGEHGLTFHPWDADPVSELIHTPLAVKYPQLRRAGMTFDHLVSHRDIPATIAAVAGDIEPNSTSGTRVIDTSSREVTSLSNNAIRISWPDGHLIRRRDGSKDSFGTIPDDPQVQPEDIAFPNCVNNSGEIPGVEQSEVAERLEALGYK